MANVFIDVELLFHLWRGDPHIHRHLHSYMGGTAMGAMAGVLVFAVLQATSRIQPVGWLYPDRVVATKKARLLAHSVQSGVIGGVSHVFLDSMMHRDMHPFWPLAYGNRLVGLVDIGTLHIGCALAGFFGLIFWVLLRQR